MKYILAFYIFIYYISEVIIYGSSKIQKYNTIAFIIKMIAVSLILDWIICVL